MWLFRVNDDHSQWADVKLHTTRAVHELVFKKRCIVPNMREVADEGLAVLLPLPGSVELSMCPRCNA